MCNPSEKLKIFHEYTDVWCWICFHISRTQLCQKQLWILRYTGSKKNSRRNPKKKIRKKSQKYLGEIQNPKQSGWGLLLEMLANLPLYRSCTIVFGNIYQFHFYRFHTIFILALKEDIFQYRCLGNSQTLLCLKSLELYTNPEKPSHFPTRSPKKQMKKSIFFRYILNIGFWIYFQRLMLDMFAGVINTIVSENSGSFFST